MTPVHQVRQYVAMIAENDPAEARRLAIAWVVGVAMATELDAPDSDLEEFVGVLMRGSDDHADWMGLARWAGQCDLPDDPGPAFAPSLRAVYRAVRRRLTPLGEAAFADLGLTGL